MTYSDMYTRSPFTGSLSSKRKHELVEIAEALNISDPEAKMTELKEKIQSYLDINESKLVKEAQFKGLYGRKRAYVHHAGCCNGLVLMMQ